MNRLACVLGMIVIYLMACCADEKEGYDSGKTGVVVSILPYQEFVERVGGDKVEVTVLVPPGADPHTYEPKPNQLTSLSDADLYISVGSGMEFELTWLSKLADLNKDMTIVNSSEGITLVMGSDPDEPGMDVHTWTSIRNAETIVENVYAALSKEDPANEGYYRANRDDYLTELQALDKGLSEALESRVNKKFIIYHPSLGYFAKDYGLEQIAIEDEGKEPSPKWMQEVIDTAKENGITVVMASPEFSTASAETVAKEINGRVVLIDPLQKDYAKGMREIAAAFN